MLLVRQSGINTIQWNELNRDRNTAFEKYIYSNRKIELQIRKAILNDLYGVNKIPKEWRGWINKIRFYIENIPKINKLNARM